MPVEVFELWNSRSSVQGFAEQSATLELFVRGTDDDAVARAAVLAFIPLGFYGLLFRDMSIECIGGVCWTATIQYESNVTESVPGQGGVSPPPPPPPPPAPTDPLGPGFGFSIGTVAEKIYQSILTVSETRASGAVFPFTNKKAIGITADGEVEGVDAVRPQMEIEITRTIGFITLNYCKTLESLIGTTNLEPFWGWDIGEALFIGCTGQTKGYEGTELTYKFAISPNEEDIVISPDITVPFKGGHDYLWVQYEPAINMMVQIKTMLPTAAYVETIYYPADYSLIGVG